MSVIRRPLLLFVATLAVVATACGGSTGSTGTARGRHGRNQRPYWAAASSVRPRASSSSPKATR